MFVMAADTLESHVYESYGLHNSPPEVLEALHRQLRVQRSALKTELCALRTQRWSPSKWREIGAIQDELKQLIAKSAALRSLLRKDQSVERRFSPSRTVHVVSMFGDIRLSCLVLLSRFKTWFSDGNGD